MRILIFPLLAMITTFPNLVAASGLPSWCVDAYSSGETEKAESYARQISMGFFRYSPEDAKLAEECLTEYSGTKVTFVPELRAFYQADELAAALIEAEQIIADREAKKLARETERAEQAEREAEEERERVEEEKARKDAVKLRQQLADELQIERIFKVRQKLGEACERLYHSSEDQAITNNLCFEYFLEQGLPTR